MLTWTNQELDDFCEHAIELLNKKKQLQLELRNCWLFSNSSGSNLHIVFYNGFLNKEFHLCGNGRVLQENAANIDKAADLEKVDDIKLKIALRIAYLIYKDCQRAMKQDKQRGFNMGQQLGISESSTIIANAIKATGENFDRDFYHDHLVPGSFGFSVTIVDKTLAKEISKVSKDFSGDDFAFTLNIPYEYFDDDPLPGDAKLGIDAITHIEVKAELRCMALITKTYEK